jgi:phenylacetate-CoA ligase
MGTIGVVSKFVESNWIIERSVREVLERLPLKLRYGISYGPTFRSWLAFLNESEKWDSLRLESYQIEQLKDLLIHAANYVPYYRKVFQEHAFRPEKVQSLNDLKVLPYIDKEIVRDSIGAFLADNISRRTLFRKNTSGSTGIPLAIYSNKEAEEKHWATVVYAWSKMGYSAKSRIVTFWGIAPKWKRYANQLILSRFHFDDVSLYEFEKRIRAFEPEFILGLPSVLFLFAQFMKDKEMRPFEGIRACIVESESLYPWQKELIGEKFGARTFSTYGMVEKVLYASECAGSSRYHIYPQYGIPETIKVINGIEELVGTGFINYANPLIRYKTADLGTLTSETCSCCGFQYESLDLIEGRIGSLLIDISGRALSPMRVGVNSTVFENVRMFQFYQDAPGKAVLRLARKESFSSGDLENIRRKVMTDLGLGERDKRLEIEIVFVGDVQRAPSGKYNMVEQTLNIRDFFGAKEKNAGLPVES